MQFGLGQQTAGGKFDWSHIHRHMAGRWVALTPGQTTRYAELVMAQLSEPATDKPFFTDGILKKDILQHYELNKVYHVIMVLSVSMICACMPQFLKACLALGSRSVSCSFSIWALAGQSVGNQKQAMSC